MTPGRDRRGFALVAVLWVLVLAGAVAAALYGAGRAERLAAINARAGAASYWAARGAIALAVDSLDRFLRAPTGDASWPAAGDTLLTPFEFVGGDAVARAVIRDARARVNINTADSTTLVRLLVAVEVPPDEAAALAARILDWRDADDAPRLRGAEVAAYADRDPADGPADAPFADPSELRGVLGMPPDLFRRLRPLITTYGDGLINLNTAPAIVLAATFAIDAETADAIVLRRTRRPLRTASDLGRLLDLAPLDNDSITARTAFFPRHVEIETEAWVRGVRTAPGPLARVELLGGPAWRVDAVREHR